MFPSTLFFREGILDTYQSGRNGSFGSLYYSSAFDSVSLWRIILYKLNNNRLLRIYESFGYGEGYLYSWGSTVPDMY